MKNEKLKNLLSRKMAASAQEAEVSLLNKEELIFALGGAAAGCDCGALTSCGKYCNCSVKIGSLEAEASF